MFHFWLQVHQIILSFSSRFKIQNMDDKWMNVLSCLIGLKYSVVNRLENKWLLQLTL